jgi:hypothetical protein
VSGVRLVVPVGDKRAFPWEAARRALKNIDGMSFESLDIPALVAAGKKMGWSPAMIDHHWKMMANGRCFRFDQDDEPFVGGSLYEDNVFFSFDDAEHDADCRPIIEQIARSLGLEIREE